MKWWIPKSPCLSILSHNLINCMMWGYLHDLGNGHFMGFKPYHVAICCYNIIEWYCGSLRSSISSSHQSHSHAITCCDGGRGLWIDGCPAGPPGVRRSPVKTFRSGEGFNIQIWGEKTMNHFGSSKQLKIPKSIKIFWIHSFQKVGPAPLFPKIQSEFRLFR